VLRAQGVEAVQPADDLVVVLDFVVAGPAGDAVAFINSASIGITSFAQLLPLISDVAGGCQIALNAADTLFMLNVSKAQLDAGDFAFP